MCPVYRVLRIKVLVLKAKTKVFFNPLSFPWRMGVFYNVTRVLKYINNQNKNNVFYLFWVKIS